MAVLMPKIEPAITQLAYQVPNGTSYIDIAKDLSKVNRRLYRQGYTYVVQDVQFFLVAGMKATDVQSIMISTAGNSWIVHNAWKKGFRAWRDQIKSVTNQADAGEGPHGRHIHGLGMGAIEGSWADYKVYLDDSMEDGTTLEPYAGDGAVYQAGEWAYSALVFDDDGTERDLKMHLIGSSNLADTNEESGIGLINEYQNSRARVNSDDPTLPAEASDTIYAKLWGTDEMSDRLVDNVESANDNPPYDVDDYPGGAVNADSAVPVRLMSCNATQGMSNVAGFIAPCGLLKVDNVEYSLNYSDPPSVDDVYAAGTAPTALVILTMAAGPYRGVLAAPMGQ